MFLRATPVEPPNIPLRERAMRHLNKIDWSILFSLLLACVLTVIDACVQPSGPLGAPNVVPTATVSSVRMALARSTLAPGQTTQATVVATSADGKVVAGRVDFASQNPPVAAVSSNGVVTALTTGVAIIQATVANRAASATLTVKSLVPPVAVVAVALDSTSLAIGDSAKASATVKDSAGNLITGQTVTWTSLSPTIATVSSTATVTAVAAGSATIQGTVLGKVGSASLTVLQVPASTVAAVVVQVDSTTLSVGHVAHASATARDAIGNPITGQEVTWASLTPAIATISSSGAVTAVAPGPALIQGTVSGTTGLDTVMVLSRNLAFNDFNNGTKGPYSIWSDMDFPVDPTGSGRGRVARIYYAPTTTNASADRYLEYHVADSSKLRYGRTIWMRGDFYLPYAGSDHKAADNRKLIDFGGSSNDGWTGGGVRMVIHRRESDIHPGKKVLELSASDWMRGNGYEEETVYEETGIEINDDTWYTIEVKMVTNSADNVRDGVLEIYMNGEATPSYRRSTGLGWITEAFAPVGPDNIPRVGSYFSHFRVGSQLTIHYPSDPLYTEYRYWDNVGFSTTRMGR